ncbi:hypothetical protein ACHAWT_009084 [Skeletonema menzelii]|mmetsp:Transcript_8928/g.14622  ORF Transcript_8928/g.14622 Transcript_8928/m.14622 type:complete len:631 (-) Transcript_8928:1484-3376(-)|eukprot:scaffold1446_cov145-Skeletonema_menzelii.AAC.24
MPLGQLALLPFLVLVAVISYLPGATVQRQRSLQQSGEALCNNAVATSSSSDTLLATSTAYGILFTVSSSNNERVDITSLGFYVDENELGLRDVTYEVWTRRGHYADPERTNDGNGGLPLNAAFDYRGIFEYWDRVAVGTFNLFNLQQGKYFQIPFARFTNTFITGGEVRSFYVTLKEVSALVQAPLENWEDFGDQQLTVHCLDNGGDISWCQNNGGGKKQPNIHIGEGVVSYPFYTEPYFYHVKKFMGSIYYLDACATRFPTISPTRMPTDKPSAAITRTPTTTAPTISPTATASPTPRYFFEVDNRCYWYLTTDAQYELFRNETSSSYGMLLPIQSNEEDTNSVLITSLGFHVDLESIRSQNNGGSVSYEVYALVGSGQYADTNRTSMTFDYRGDFSFWKKISHGTVISQNGDSDYFQIPFENFSPTYVPPKGGVRSFYLTLNAPALVYKELDKRQGIGKKQKDDDYSSNQKRGDTPTLMIGETVIGYPFISAEFLYSPKQFVGKIFQAYDCPSQSPSLQPSEVPSQIPSGKPSVSTKPTKSPSFYPSASPSISPTISFRPTPAPSDLPTSVPSTSLHPTITRIPTDSPTTSSPVQALNRPNSSSSLTQQKYLLKSILCTVALLVCFQV